ncbi:MAG: hypothetical protein ACFFD4_17025 [Candidatus Odinarchaeota archaeon]
MSTKTSQEIYHGQTRQLRPGYLNLQGKRFFPASHHWFLQEILSNIDFAILKQQLKEFLTFKFTSKFNSWILSFIIPGTVSGGVFTFMINPILQKLFLSRVSHARA